LVDSGEQLGRVGKVLWRSARTEASWPARQFRHVLLQRWRSQHFALFKEKNVKIDELYYRKGGYFPGRELYFFDPSGNRLELRDPTWKAGMPEPSFDEVANG
jgi:hypothetical protein